MIYYVSTVPSVAVSVLLWFIAGVAFVFLYREFKAYRKEQNVSDLESDTTISASDQTMHSTPLTALARILNVPDFFTLRRMRTTSSPYGAPPTIWKANQKQEETKQILCRGLTSRTLKCVPPQPKRFHQLLIAYILDSGIMTSNG